MKRKGWIFASLAVVVMAGAGFGYWQTGQTGLFTKAQSTTQATSAYQTATVHTGSLTISITGSGVVVSPQSVDLGFPVSGTVGTLNAQVGDTVKKGQALASLSGTDALKLAVSDQQVAVMTAQKALNDLTGNSNQSLAQALLDQSTAEAAYKTAQANLRTPGEGRCEQQTTEKYYYEWLDLQKAINYWQGQLGDPKTGYGRNFILKNLNPLLEKSYIAWANYNYCQTFTQAEIDSSQAALQMAKAKYDQATRAFETLKASSGVDTSQMEIAQATLTNAQLALIQAQNNLNGATLTAPIDGTVTAVNGQVGDAVGTGVFITIKTQDQLQVQVNVDETDLENFTTGCPATVTFDALSGQTFKGTVSQVFPLLGSSLSSSNLPSALASALGNTSAQGLIDLDKSKTLAGKPLALGMTASAEITCYQADNVLLVASQGIYRPANQSPYVYVLNVLGQPEKREITLGKETVALAEIKSGLKAGDKVIISQVEK